MAKKPKEKEKIVDPNAVVLRIWGAARLLSCSDRAAERLVRTGQLKSFRVGRMRLVRRKSIEEFCAAKEQEAS